jgi:hypothetical protein
VFTTKTPLFPQAVINGPNAMGRITSLRGIGEYLGPSEYFMRDMGFAPRETLVLGFRKNEIKAFAETLVMFSTNATLACALPSSARSVCSRLASTHSGGGFICARVRTTRPSFGRLSSSTTFASTTATMVDETQVQKIVKAERRARDAIAAAAVNVTEHAGDDLDAGRVMRRTIAANLGINVGDF